MSILANGDRESAFKTGKTLGRRIEEPILRSLVWLLVRIQVEGREQTPRRSPLIMIMNHVHWLDPVIVLAKTPRYVAPIAKAETMRYPLLGPLIRWYSVIPIHRGSMDLAAMRRSEAELAAGEALLLAPEGTRSKTGGLQVGKPGLVSLARRSNPIIQPVAIIGATELGPSLRRLRRCSIHLRFGEPFRFRWFPGRLTRDRMQQMTDEAMHRIAHLLPVAMRGVYADLDAATSEYLEFDLGGEV